MSIRKLRTDEAETTFTIEATNRSVVRVYSADPVYRRKLERVGATLVEEMEDGGAFYTLPSNQLRISKPPRKLSEAEKAESAKHLAMARQANANHG